MLNSKDDSCQKMGTCRQIHPLLQLGSERPGVTSDDHSAELPRRLKQVSKTTLLPSKLTWSATLEEPKLGRNPSNFKKWSSWLSFRMKANFSKKRDSPPVYPPLKLTASFCPWKWMLVGRQAGFLDLGFFPLFSGAMPLCCYISFVGMVYRCRFFFAQKKTSHPLGRLTVWDTLKISSPPDAPRGHRKWSDASSHMAGNRAITQLELHRFSLVETSDSKHLGALTFHTNTAVSKQQSSRSQTWQLKIWRKKIPPSVWKLFKMGSERGLSEFIRYEYYMR